MRKYLITHKPLLYLTIVALTIAVAAGVFFLNRHDPQQKLSSVSGNNNTLIPNTTQRQPPRESKQNVRSYPWHKNITSTTFWVGEIFNSSLSDGSQVCSTYDTQWAYHWSGGVNHGQVPADASGCAGSIVGGCDGTATSDGHCETEKRTASNDYFPSHAIPKENPFYLDIPYDDLNDSVAFAERCNSIPWVNDTGYAGHCADRNFSYMKNKFLRIVGPNGATCYGQVEDAGPSHDNLYHDSAYVFGANDVRPLQQNFNNAGMDVSPALNGCLGYSDLNGEGDKVTWQFVDTKDVPDGPWKKVITTSGVTN